MKRRQLCWQCIAVSALLWCGCGPAGRPAHTADAPHPSQGRAAPLESAPRDDTDADRDAAVPTHEPDENVIRAPSEDPELEQARILAQQTIDEFLVALDNPRPGRRLALKVAFATPDGGAEHMWVTPSAYVNGVFRGMLDNEPRHVPDLKVGDAVSVKRDDVEDWAIFEEDASGRRSIRGGYSIQVLLARRRRQ
jgi:uncharacterized protein YegJ (DUF2314 family)